MSLAEDARAAVRRRPFLLVALRAGVVNYRAAARFLAPELAGEVDAIATALRRFAEDGDDVEEVDRDVRVAMESGLGPVDPAEALLSVGDTALGPTGGSLTGIVATGEVDGDALAHVLGRLKAAGITVAAAGVGAEALAVAVDRRDGADALRAVEDALSRVPSAAADGP